MPETGTERDDPPLPGGESKPIGVPWGRIGRQVFAFFLVVAVVLIVVEYLTGAFR